jgi:hypothetical protein
VPLHVLQVVPHFVNISAAASRPFNLFGALAMLLGPRGWGRVLVPMLWSPGRTPDQLRQAFALRMLLEDLDDRGLLDLPVIQELLEYWRSRMPRRIHSPTPTRTIESAKGMH